MNVSLMLWYAFIFCLQIIQCFFNSHSLFIHFCPLYYNHKLQNRDDQHSPQQFIVFINNFFIINARRSPLLLASSLLRHNFPQSGEILIFLLTWKQRYIMINPLQRRNDAHYVFFIILLISNKNYQEEAYERCCRTDYQGQWYSQ